MSTQTASKSRTRKPTQAALREQTATAKAEATQAVQAAKVEAAEEAVQAATPAEAGLDSDIRRNRYVTDYRSAERQAGQSKHAANVAAVAYFRTLPETVTVTTAKSKVEKPVSARERAEKTLEALCVHVERNANGKVTKGLDSIGFTVQRVTQLVDAFRNAEVALSTLRVEKIADALNSKEPIGSAQEVGDIVADSPQVEKLVSTLDQARVVGGKKAADALASSIREQIEEEVATGEDVAPLAVALENAQTGVKRMREGKAEQAKSTDVVKTGSQKIGDAVQVLWDAIEANASDLDAGQKSALVGKIQALHAHALKHLA